MLRKWISVFVFLFACSTWPVAEQVTAQGNDYAAHTPWHSTTKGTPLDVGKLVLDAPAGKHGFVQVKDGHFYFQNGTRVKFWGANLGRGANFPSHRDADILADKLATLGFNAIRIHNIDNDSKGATIIDRAQNHSQSLDAAALDKLDYLIYVLKAKGIYVVMDVQTSRRYKAGDQVVDYDQLPRGMAKTVGYFDDRIMELEKGFADALFGHVNPYTKLAYKDDPALALVGMLNEDYFFKPWKDGALDASSNAEYMVPSYYLEQLDAKFNSFILNKYGTQAKLQAAWSGSANTQNLIKNGSFANDISQGWTITTDETLTTTAKLDSGSSPHGSTHLKFAKIQPQPTAGGAYSALSLKQHGVKLKKGHTYQLDFYVKTSEPGKGTLKVRFDGSHHLDKHYGLDKNFKFTESQAWTAYSTTFVALEDSTADPNASLSFYCGWCWGDFEFDHIQLKEIQLPGLLAGESLAKANLKRIAWEGRFHYSPQRFADTTEFYYSIVHSYFTEMKEYLREEVGLQVPISTSNNYTMNAEIMARTVGDFMDAHVYWDHPKFSAEHKWSTEQFSITNDSIIAKAGNMKDRRWFSRWVEYLALNRVEGMPFVVGEWQLPFPNEYEFEAAPLISAYAQLQDWDGLFIFNYSETNTYENNAERIGYWFDIIGNPSKLAQMPTYALSFLKGYVRPAEHSVTVQYNNNEVFASTGVNSDTPTYNIKDELPTALLYKHMISKAFGAERTSMSSDLIDEETDEALSQESVHRSDTDELIWDASVEGNETFLINTPKSQSITGFMTGRTLRTSNMEVRLSPAQYPFGSVALQPLDDRRIQDSRSMLLTLISRQSNSEQEQEASTGLFHWGQGPTRMQQLTGKVTISLKLADTDQVEVRQLNTAGTRELTLPVKMDRLNQTIVIEIERLSSPYLHIVKLSS
ncbi:carbohydrate binding domain-containing protein [Paenibacillus sp. YYML68]|uniref:carbohydrate binding domain-containing protein n=1 Tax=Paenibacillus sp. YYML68 TaxID=2909250 RepID=UPI002493A4E1|nr:carbohydrate binding domain-containing protein [Paenibacillus sp. YYML68]